MRVMQSKLGLTRLPLWGKVIDERQAIFANRSSLLHIPVEFDMKKGDPGSEVRKFSLYLDMSRVSNRYRTDCCIGTFAPIVKAS